MAADQLFHRYLSRLSRLARSRLSSKLARRIDPEDVVMSAYRSFFVAADAGRFSIEHSGDLWALLTKITLRKLYRSVAHHTAEKRNLYRDCDVSDGFDLNKWAAGSLASHEEAVALADELEMVLSQLTQQQRRIIEMRLQGEQVLDIAAELGVNEKTVRRIIEKVVLDARRRYGFDDDVDSARPPLKNKHAEVSADVPMLDIVTHTVVASLATSVMFDEILLQQLIGRGGMGKVFRAIHRPSQTLRAVKFLHKSFQNDQQAVSRFIQEAEAVRQLQHPGIVRWHGLGQTAGGVLFIVMDLIEGETLQQQNLAFATGEVQPAANHLRTMVHHVANIADAISHAHGAGIIHCDLKPANVMINQTGRPILTDFGLARILEHSESRPYSLAGTAPWMAPEQVDEHFGPITAATDVYGLGALLYSLLTGQPPYLGTRTADIFSRVVSGEMPRPPSTFNAKVREPLERICMACLSKCPAERPESAALVGQLLDAEFAWLSFDTD